VRSTISFREAVSGPGPVLTDGGIETRVMFETTLTMDPEIGSASLLASEASAAVLGGIYQQYVAAAQDAGLPVVIGTPTFRASQEPVRRAGQGRANTVAALNRAAVRLLERIRADSDYAPVWIAGVIGPSGDAYTPRDSLPANRAREYHLPQANVLAEAGVDFLFAPTFPAVGEAIGVCQAMQTTGLPFVVSFVLDRSGSVLDGTPLTEAIGRVDEVAGPLYHSISCVHASTAARALAAVANTTTSGRVREVKANASPLTPAELVALDHVEGDDPKTFAAQMTRLYRDFDVAVVGGCCGTNDRHIAALARSLVAD
jgi:S-methylmethionine-dependent homocysteine/selenocysteine methylase